MKKLLALALSFALLFSMSATAFASQSGEVVKTESAPTIDGQIDAVWENANIYQMTNYNVAEKDNAELDPVKDAADFSGQWRALWDDDYFYALVEITDDVISDISLERDGSHSRDDGVRVLLGQEGNNHLIALFHAKSQDMYHLTLGPNEWNERDKDQVDYAVSEVADGYIVEVAIPWKIAGLNPLTAKAGESYKLDIQAVDNDFLENTANEIGVEGRYPQSRLSWSYDQDALTADTINPPTADLGTITLVADSNDSSADSGAEAPATDGDTATSPTAGGSDSSGNTSTPDMPKTGMGGTSNNVTTWALLAVFIATIAAVGFARLRRN